MTTNEETAAGVPRWVWIAAFVVGVAFLTFVRPVLQHVPEPPPALGPFPEGSGVDALGDVAAFGGSGSLRLVSLEPLGGSPAQTRRTLRKLGFVMTEMEFGDVELLTLVESSGEARAKSARLAASTEWTTIPWRRVGISSAMFGRVSGQLDAVAGLGASSGADIVLLDRQGRVRGSYSSAGVEVVSELYHRLSHVDRTEANVDQSGPQ
jgi:hypothetical protein